MKERSFTGTAIRSQGHAGGGVEKRLGMAKGGRDRDRVRAPRGGGLWQRPLQPPVGGDKPCHIRSAPRLIRIPSAAGGIKVHSRALCRAGLVVFLFSIVIKSSTTVQALVFCNHCPHSVN